MDIVFGPIKSRRFGISLGVDLSPSVKQCNFDCVYCELEPLLPPQPKTVSEFSNVLPLDILLDCVIDALNTNKNIDVLTITANGEPTMYPYLNEFMIGIKPYIPDGVKSLILSNGSLFWDTNVQRALLEFDIVKFSLDSVSPSSFKKVDRPNKILDLEEIKKGIADFARLRNNILICEILIVDGINDSSDDILELVDFLKSINVDRIDLGTIDRPPAYRVKPVSYDKLLEISKLFDGLFVSLPARECITNNSLFNLDVNQILNTLKRRPIAVNEAPYLFTKDTIDIFNRLLNEGIISVKSVGLIDFYTF